MSTTAPSTAPIVEPSSAGRLISLKLTSYGGVEGSHVSFRLCFEDHVRDTEPATTIEQVFRDASRIAAAWGLLGEPLIPTSSVVSVGDRHQVTLRRPGDPSAVPAIRTECNPLVAAMEGWLDLFNRGA